MFHCCYIWCCLLIIRAGKSEVEIVQGKIAELEGKLGQLEKDLQKPGVSDAEWMTLQQRLAAQEQRLATLRKNETILLEKAQGRQQQV